MTSVYLINVGANTKDSSKARSPLFINGSFIYVSFTEQTAQCEPGYSARCLPFLRGVERLYTHADPDWDNLSYGDNCSNFRAAALRSVKKGDILLFWGLLWQNCGSDWSGFTKERGWYLFGTLRVEEIAEGGQSLQQLSEQNRNRAAQNVHFVRARSALPHGERVFLGALDHSRCFERAVDLEVNHPDGLIYRAFTSANGCLLSIDGRPCWSSSLRACRRIWNLGNPIDQSRAMLVRDAVRDRTGFDFLAGV